MAGLTSKRTGTSPRKPRSWRPLADVETEGRLALAGLAAVDQREGVFDLQAAELVGQRAGWCTSRRRGSDP